MELGKIKGFKSKWWKAIPSKKPIIAYQPMGASSLATSYVNLANTGTNNAIPGSGSYAPPTWNATDGWIFNELAQYLDMGVAPESNWSVIARFSNVTGSGKTLFGIFSGNYGRFLFFTPSNGAYRVYGAGSSTISLLGIKTEGIVGISQYQPYFNGVPDGVPVSSGEWTDPGDGLSFLIGCFDMAGDSPLNFIAANIQAFVLYNQTLSAPEMAIISKAMASI